MNLTKVIAHGLVSTMLTEAVHPKKDENEIHEHTHEEQQIDKTIRIGKEARPEATRPMFTIRSFAGAMGTPVSDYCYSWEGVMQSAKERFEFEHHGVVSPEPQVMDSQDQTGCYWLLTFDAPGAHAAYKVQSWTFANPSIKVRREDRLVGFGWHPDPDARPASAS